MLRNSFNYLLDELAVLKERSHRQMLFIFRHSAIFGLGFVLYIFLGNHAAIVSL